MTNIAKQHVHTSVHFYVKSSLKVDMEYICSVYLASYDYCSISLFCRDSPAHRAGTNASLSYYKVLIVYL